MILSNRIDYLINKAFLSSCHAVLLRANLKLSGTKPDRA